MFLYWAYHRLKGVSMHSQFVAFELKTNIKILAAIVKMLINKLYIETF